MVKYLWNIYKFNNYQLMKCAVDNNNLEMVQFLFEILPAQSFSGLSDFFRLWRNRPPMPKRADCRLKSGTV